MSDSKSIELQEREEIVNQDQWVSPFSRLEKYEKLKPSLSRELKTSTGETISVIFSDPEESAPEQSPKRKELTVILKNADQDFYYQVEARIPRYPDSIRIGVPNHAPDATAFETWVTEEIGSGIDDDIDPEEGKDIQGSPFLCNHLDEIDTVQIRYTRIKH